MANPAAKTRYLKEWTMRDDALFRQAQARQPSYRRFSDSFTASLTHKFEGNRYRVDALSPASSPVPRRPLHWVFHRVVVRPAARTRRPIEPQPSGRLMANPAAKTRYLKEWTMRDDALFRQAQARQPSYRRFSDSFTASLTHKFEGNRYRVDALSPEGAGMHCNRYAVPTSLRRFRGDSNRRTNPAPQRGDCFVCPGSPSRWRWGRPLPTPEPTEIAAD